jgi:hypothetical protein
MKTILLVTTDRSGKKDVDSLESASTTRDQGDQGTAYLLQQFWVMRVHQTPVRETPDEWMNGEWMKGMNAVRRWILGVGLVAAGVLVGPASTG